MNLKQGDKICLIFKRRCKMKICEILTLTGVDIGFLGRPQIMKLLLLGLLLEMALLWIFESVPMVFASIFKMFLFNFGKFQKWSQFTKESCCVLMK